MPIDALAMTFLKKMYCPNLVDGCPPTVVGITLKHRAFIPVCFLVWGVVVIFFKPLLNKVRGNSHGYFDLISTYLLVLIVLLKTQSFFWYSVSLRYW